MANAEVTGQTVYTLLRGSDGEGFLIGVFSSLANAVLGAKRWANDSEIVHGFHGPFPTGGNWECHVILEDSGSVTHERYEIACEELDQMADLGEK